MYDEVTTGLMSQIKQIKGSTHSFEAYTVVFLLIFESI